ncbi:MAG: outer membrane protein assembly factor BamA [Candidatus Firestonebacteria bacterium RIFOXYC2_FULL_39_67]|nr:MAG: outer membrane protein assembly factor BamA [Candidatus Firestonebacteria bacterium RIFOXYD2_FULL_39_29]OGF52797.1 MAG: outer membrane protein assembly factor BamA [Candidatus Firestonebacteria bacterium RifOxyC12_full_39_7]OGF54866.1 MAG: outer membrane protein assembly factor BamA [Candidatus Firestonebacteria bacterium RIFOXYC2_FULL_39_67]
MRKLVSVMTIIIITGACVFGEVTAPNNSINKITFVGVKNIKTDLITAVMSLKTKTEYSEAKALLDFKKIFNLGYFSDVEIAKDEGIEGIEIIVTVKEKPVVEEISFIGVKEVGRGDLETEAGFVKGDSYELSLIKKAVEKLLAKYQEKGYNLAAVTYEIKEDEKNNKVKVTFNINEGRHMYVSKIKFLGIKNFTESVLKGKMETSEAAFLVAGTFSEETLSRDFQKIVAYYKSEGFYLANIFSHKVTYDDIKEKIFIDITVDEGDQYKFSEVQFSVTNEKIYEVKDLAAAFNLKKDDIFNYEVYARDLDKIRFMYSEKGYIETEVSGDVFPDKGKKTVFVMIKIKESGVFFIDKIRIENNYKTKDNVILRELTLKEGEAFDSVKIRRSLEKIYNLGFFEEVSPGLLPVAGKPDRRELVLTIKERQTGQLQLGANFSSLDGLTGMLSVSENNFLGNGQRISVSWEFGSSRQSYDLSFFEPWLMGSPVSAGASLYNVLKAYYADYKDQRIGGNIRFGLPLNDNTRLWLTYKYEQVNIYDVAVAASSLIQSVAGTNDISSITAQWVKDTRDSIFFNTKSGYKLSASIEYAGGLILGTTNFTKYVVDASTFFSISGDLVLALRASTGYTTGFGSTPNVPFYEKFFVGGTDTVRGYGERILSPLDNTGTPVGGNFMTLGNAELRFPIYGPIFGTAFFDAGKAWDHVTAFDTANIPTSVGFGLRIMIGGALMIRIDYGYGFSPQATQGGQIHFNMGNIF